MNGIVRTLLEVWLPVKVRLLVEVTELNAPLFCFLNVPYCHVLQQIYSSGEQLKRNNLTGYVLTSRVVLYLSVYLWPVVQISFQNLDTILMFFMVFRSCFRQVFEYYLQIGHRHFLKHPFYLILITILPYGTDMCINPQTKHYKENNCLFLA
jgi:hypothetical protein